MWLSHSVGGEWRWKRACVRQRLNQGKFHWPLDKEGATECYDVDERNHLPMIEDRIRVATLIHGIPEVLVNMGVMLILTSGWIRPTSPFSLFFSLSLSSRLGCELR